MYTCYERAKQTKEHALTECGDFPPNIDLGVSRQEALGLRDNSNRKINTTAIEIIKDRVGGLAVMSCVSQKCIICSVANPPRGYVPIIEATTTTSARALHDISRWKRKQL